MLDKIDSMFCPYVKQANQQPNDTELIIPRSWVQFPPCAYALVAQWLERVSKVCRFIPRGPTVRICGFHPHGPGSIPGAEV